MGATSRRWRITINRSGARWTCRLTRARCAPRPNESSTGLSQARGRCIGPQETLRLKFVPQLVGDVASHETEVFAHLLAAHRTWDHRDDASVSNWELQGGSGERDTIALADLLNALRLGDDWRFGRRIAVERGGPRSTREDPRGVRCPDHDRHTPRGAHLKLLETLLLEQCVGHGDEKKVDRPAL